jgi:hypothetical protein
MPFRAPKNFWEWVLLFSPAMVIWAATAIAFVLPPPGFEWGLYFPILGALAGSVIALLLCVYAGYLFTKPTPEPSGRHMARFASASLIAFLNLGIAFGGCAVVLR